MVTKKKQDAMPWEETVEVKADKMPWTSSISGKTYFMQKGKSVTFLSGGGMGLTLLAAEFENLQNRIRSMENPTDAQQAAANEKAEHAMNRMAKEMANLISTWSLIGWRGEKLEVPTPDTYEILLELPEDALGWLFGKAVQGDEEIPAEDDEEREKDI